MEKKKIRKMGDFSGEDSVRLLIDLIHRTIMHHGLWFSEVNRRLGTEASLELLEKAWERSLQIQMKRLCDILGVGTRGGLPLPLLEMPEEKLNRLLDAVSINWLVNDGVWFQAVENDADMAGAKACNDACWSLFSPVEARAIRRTLDLPGNPGLDGLKEALNFRLYARINTQSIVEEGPHSFIFRMNACRVQAARERKGLADYPCKSGGVVEYATFARTIDPRIETECIACPPDSHPPEWFCAWRFRIPE